MTILKEVAVKPSGHSGLEAASRLAIDVLRRDGVIAYPTETVYGLGCDFESEIGYRLILGLKGLRRRKPLILLIPDVSWLSVLMSGTEGSPVLQDLIDTFWPGPLTVMGPASSDVPEHLLGEGRTISMRLSSDRFVRFLLRAYRRPITSTSANPTDRNPSTGLADLRACFSDSRHPIGLAVNDGERCGLPSTIVRLKPKGIIVVREGAIPAERIRSACRA